MGRSRFWKQTLEFSWFKNIHELTHLRQFIYNFRSVQCIRVPWIAQTTLGLKVNWGHTGWTLYGMGINLNCDRSCVLEQIGTHFIIGWHFYRVWFFGFVAFQWRRLAKIAATAIVPMPYPKNYFELSVLRKPNFHQKNQFEIVRSLE